MQRATIQTSVESRKSVNDGAYRGDRCQTVSCSWLIHAHTRPDVSRCFFSDTCPCRLSLIMFFNLSVVLSLASSAPTPHIRHRSIHTYDIGTSFTHEIGDFRFRFCTLFVDVVRARVPPPARRRRGTPGSRSTPPARDPPALLALGRPTRVRRRYARRTASYIIYTGNPPRHTDDRGTAPGTRRSHSASHRPDQR